MARRTALNNDEECWFPSEEELNNMDWSKYISLNKKVKLKAQPPMSKLEWKIKCFIHRIRNRINRFLLYFSSDNEY